MSDYTNFNWSSSVLPQIPAAGSWRNITKIKGQEIDEHQKDALLLFWIYCYEMASINDWQHA
jgi:hypothetical protein